MNNDKVTIFGKEVAFHFSTSGHYCINIIPEFHMRKSCNKIILMSENNISDKKEVQTNNKNSQTILPSIKRKYKESTYHYQFNVKCFKQIINKVIDSYKTCQKLRKPPSKTVAAFTKSDSFNETLSIDLHESKPNLWYLHVVDEFSRFSAA